MKKLVRTALLVMHVGGLALGLFMAGLGIRSVIENCPTDALDLALSRIATTSTITVIAIAYAVTLLRRGFTPAAPFLYALSFGIAGIVVEMNGRMIAKNFAPAAPEELSALYASVIAQLVVVLGAAFAAWLWTHRHSR